MPLPGQHLWHGTFTDADSGEPLPYATWYDTLSRQGGLANAAGYATVVLTEATGLLRVTHAGYLPQYLPLTAAATHFHLALQPRPLDTVVIDGTHPATQGMIGRVTFSMAQVRNQPALGGEADLVKALQTLPAASGGAEGSSDLHVRGGSRGQNLYLLDGIPLNHSSHLFSLFSVFNPDAISQIDFYASGFPLRYGGRLSSVVDIQVRAGHQHRWRGKVDLGVVTSKALIEGPVGKKASLLVAVRSSYLELFNLGREAQVRAERWESRSLLNLGFADLNAKYVYAPKPGQRLSLSYYGGHDRLHDLRNGVSNLLDNWQRLRTQGGSLRYQWTPKARWYMEGTLYGVDTRTRSEQATYSFDRRLIQPPDSLFFLQPEVQLDTVSAGTRQGQYRQASLGGRFHLQTQLGRRHTLEAGGEWARHGFWPGDIQQREVVWQPRYRESFVAQSQALAQAWEGALYAGYQGQASARWSVSAGLRLAAWQHERTRYLHPLPRLQLGWRPGNWGMLQLAYDHTVQYPHVLVRPEQFVSHTAWVPSTDRLRPQQAQQVSLGLGDIRLGEGIRLASTAFYKQLRGLSMLPYLPGEVMWVNEWENRLRAPGQGRAYGFEWHLHVRRPRWELSANYTLSWSERQFPGLNRDLWFPDDFDRRHQANVGLVFPFHPNWKFTAFWAVASGHRIQLPRDRVPGNPFTGSYYLFDRYNAHRLPLYHRLDLAIEQRIDLPQQRAWGWRASVYNAYYHLNAYYLYLEQRPFFDPHTQQSGLVDVARVVSLFPIIPALNLYFHF